MVKECRTHLKINFILFCFVFSYRGCAVYLFAITTHSGDFTDLLRFYLKVYYQSLCIETLLSRPSQPWHQRKTAISDFCGSIEGMRRGPCFLVPQHQTKIINTVSQMTRTQIVSMSATYTYSRDYSGVCDKCAYDQVLPVATLLATFANVPPGRAKEKFQSLLASSESAEGLRKSQSCKFLQEWLVWNQG